jgi:rubrerythrin
LHVDRRRFLTASFGLAGGATLLAGCGRENKGQGPIAGEKPQNPAPEPAESDVNDVNVLNSVLDLEHQAVAAYTAAMRSLRGANLRTARSFRDQERAHAAALTRAIKGMGGTANAPGSYRFPAFPTEDDVLRFAIRLENTAVAKYLDSLPRLNTAGLRAEIASIFTTEAEHLAVLNGALRERSVPTAFVTGRGVG